MQVKGEMNCTKIRGDINKLALPRKLRVNRNYMEKEESSRKEIREWGESPLGAIRNLANFIREQKIELLLSFVVEGLSEKYQLVLNLAERVLDLLRRGKESEKLRPFLTLLQSWQKNMLSDLEVLTNSVEVINSYVEELNDLLFEKLNFVIPEPEQEAIDAVFDNLRNFVAEAEKRVKEMFQPQTVRLRRKEKIIGEVTLPFLVVKPAIVEHAFSPILSIIAALEKLEEKIGVIVSLVERREKNGYFPYPQEFEEFTEDVSQISPEEINKSCRLTLRKLGTKE